MTLIRRARETQRAFVERTLREQGEVATYDVLYNAQFEDGRKTSVTRLAAIIHTLRGEGWQISTRDSNGTVAVYVLSGAVNQPAQRPAVWRCIQCASAPAHEPSPLLGGMGEAHCYTCRSRRAFTKRAA